MLYDDRVDIGPAQLEKILQGIVWLADGVVLPAYARPSPHLDAERQRLVATRLAELAEAGYLERWTLDPRPRQVAATSWWPGSVREHAVDMAAYDHLQTGVRAGVAIYRRDLLRGAGRPEGTLISGISEFVSLQDSLWTIGLARYVGADCLLASTGRSLALSAPLRHLVALGNLTGPVSKTIMELHGIGPLAHLSVKDLDRLSRYKPVTRSVIADVVEQVESDVFSTLDHQRYVETAVRSTQRHYAELLGDTVHRAARHSGLGNAVGLGITIAGTIFPPLGTLSFMEPLMAWDPHGRAGRRLVVFLTKLRKRVEEAAPSSPPA